MSVGPVDVAAAKIPSLVKSVAVDAKCRSRSQVPGDERVSASMPIAAMTVAGDEVLAWDRSGAGARGIRCAQKPSAGNASRWR
jgi:hypothetical protein